MSQTQAKPEMIELRGKTISDVPNEVRTEGKDEAARYIITEVLQEDRWPLDYSQMADESGWSRQHIANTLQDYFKETEGESGSNTTNTSNTSERVEDQFIPIPSDIENVGDYLKGVRQGMKLS